MMNEYRIGDKATLNISNLKRLFDGDEISLAYFSPGTPTGTVSLSVRQTTDGTSSWTLTLLTLNDISPDKCLKLARSLGLEPMSKPRGPESITDAIWGTDDVSAVWRTPACNVRSKGG
jgi:hypothetical protein